MRRVIINEGKVAVVTKNGNFKRLLTAGTHWLKFNEEMTSYLMDLLYTINTSWELLLRNDPLRAQVEIVEVADNEIAVRYDRGVFVNVYGTGRYFYFKGLLETNFVKYQTSEMEVPGELDRNLLQKRELATLIRGYKVENYEEGLLLIDGKFVRKLARGMHFFWNNATSVEVLKADLRQLQMEISGQEILTRDKASLRVNFNLQYQVVDAEKALLQSKDYEKQLYTLAQLALREYIGMLSLDELLGKKEEVGSYVKEFLSKNADLLGLAVQAGGIRDVILPGEVKEIMSKVLIAEKQAEANTITRREETASTRSLLNTAKLMEGNEMLFRLKEMEYVEKIADKIGDISVSGGGQVLDQLKAIFATGSR